MFNMIFLRYINVKFQPCLLPRLHIPPFKSYRTSKHITSNLVTTIQKLITPSGVCKARCLFFLERDGYHHEKGVSCLGGGREGEEMVKPGFWSCFCWSISLWVCLRDGRLGSKIRIIKGLPCVQLIKCSRSK